MQAHEQKTGSPALRQAVPSEDGTGASPAGREAALEQFAAAILAPSDLRLVLRGFYTDALHSALVDRLAGLRAAETSSLKPRSNPLPSWRLKLAQEYVEARMDEKISLKSLAGAAGVSAMHFAAQFRAATGLRPHDYLLRHRIARSRRMLLETKRPIVDIALSVGFQSQAHFTTVFKRITGFTPSAWRRLCIDEPPGSA